MPVTEAQSRFNTSPGGAPFDLYDHRQDLGNQGPPDGQHYKGRGYIGLTGRSNYVRVAQALGSGELVENPELENDPAIASRTLAYYLKIKESAIRQAIKSNDLRTARRLINGSSGGLDKFAETFELGDRLLGPDPALGPPAPAGDDRGPAVS